MLHLFNLKCSRYKNIHFGWEPWTCGYGRRLMIKRSWVRITATHTRWIIFTFICWKIVWLFEKTENKLKRGRGLSHSNKNIRFHGVEKLLLIFTRCVNCKQNTNANVIKLLFTSFSKSSSSSNEERTIWQMNCRWENVARKYFKITVITFPSRDYSFRWRQCDQMVQNFTPLVHCLKTLDILKVFI